MTDFKVGDRVKFGMEKASIRYVGTVQFSDGVWIGIELDDDNKGKNDGSVRGVKYFECKTNKGVFVRESSLTKENENGTAAAPRRGSVSDKAAANGVAKAAAKTRDRPSIAADGDKAKAAVKKVAPKARASVVKEGGEADGQVAPKARASVLKEDGEVEKPSASVAPQPTVTEAAPAATSSSPQSELQVPDELVEAIMSGTCVAFVGAGFSAAARLPGWGALLKLLLERGAADGVFIGQAKSDIADLIERGKFEQAAQMLEDKVDRKAFAEVMGKALEPPINLLPIMKERLKCIHCIPFCAILTTNFDFFLPGIPAADPLAKSQMKKILRSNPMDLAEQALNMMGILQDLTTSADILQFGCTTRDDGVILQDNQKRDTFMSAWKEIANSFVDESDPLGDTVEEMTEEAARQLLEDVEGRSQRTPILQLHGTVISGELAERFMFDDCVKQAYRKNNFAQDPGLVFTLTGYRKLLYDSGCYRNFMSSVMSTKTILYMGFSFSDHYINELRSEAMMTLHGKKEEDGDVIKPLAYAIVNGMTQSEADFYKKHEGVTFLNYPTFQSVEKWLKAISLRTNPIVRWARCLAGKTVLILAAGRQQAIVRIMAIFAKELDEDGDFGTILAYPKELIENFNESFNCEPLMTVLEEFEKEQGKFDLIIAGYRWNNLLIASKLLKYYQARGEERPPLLVVDEDKAPKGTHPAAFHGTRKREVLALGAVSYCHTVNECLDAVRDVLTVPSGNYGRADGCTVA